MSKLMRQVAELARDMVFCLADTFAEACRAVAEAGRQVDRLVARLHGPDSQGRCDWCHRPWPCHDHMAAVRRLVKDARERS